MELHVNSVREKKIPSGLQVNGVKVKKEITTEKKNVRWTSRM